jgi:HPt (histidine-containing phosphotransfer) domain-containing protein
MELSCVSALKAHCKEIEKALDSASKEELQEGLMRIEELMARLDNVDGIMPRSITT